MSAVETCSSADALDEALRRPLIIVGSVRSGTTLLHLMLGGHPGLHVLGEFEESVKWLGDDGWTPMPAYRAHLAIDRVFTTRGGPLPESDHYPDAVAEIARRYFSDLPAAARPGFVVHSRIDRVPDLWPDAMYVHLVRDPRDVANSCVGMGWAGHVWHGCNAWIESEHRFDVLAEQIPPDRRIDIRYEDVVGQPRETLGRVLEFLGLQWDEGVFSYAERSTYDRPDPAFAEQWRRKLTRRQVELVEWRCRRHLASRGYEAECTDPRAPGSIESLSLEVRHRFNRWQFSRRRYGLPLALARPIASRLPPSSRFRRMVDVRVNEIARNLLK